MGGDIKFGISLNLKGANTVTQATREIERQIRETERSFKALSESRKRSQGELADAAVKMRQKVALARKEIEKLQSTVGNTAIGKYAANIEARRTLGIRAEVDIQKEIKKTEAAYQKLVSSGVLSAQQQGRAFDAMKQKVTALTNEMGKLTVEQQKQERLGKGLRLGGIVAAGGAAALYALKEPVKKAMSFDERLAGMANTAFGERDAKGRIAGMGELEGAITKAWRTGGGTREQAADALDTLIASGAVGTGDAMSMLPALMKASKASGADASQLAKIGVTAMRGFKIDAQDLPNVMNMAMAAGQAGGFELKNMAKWLPQQMAAASMSGMSGRAGFAKLAALNQAAMITAGDKDEAGNNVVNLLAKINSSDTANDAKKLGINLPKYLQDQRARGVDSVDAFGALVDKTVSKRADYQALQKQLKSAKTDDDKKAALESMATIAQGAGIGKLIQDRQAMMALLGMMNNREYMQQVLGKVQANDVRSGGEIDTAHEVMSSRAGYKAEQAAQEALNSQTSAMNALTPAIGLVSDGFSAFAQEFPVMTAAVVGTVPPLLSLAGVAGLAALTTGGKLPVGSAITKAANLFKGSLWSGGSLLAAGSRFAGGVGLAGAVGYGAGSVLNWGIDKGIQYGTGDKNQTLGTWIYDKLHPDSPLVENLKPPAAQPKLDASLHVSVSDDRVSVRSTKLDAFGVNAQMNTGNFMTGAP